MAILNFMLYLPGQEKKETRFIEKIHSSLIQNLLYSSAYMGSPEENTFYKEISKEYALDPNVLAEKKAKNHTIRKDSENRWKPGMKIDFFINARTKKMLRFAPRVPVKSLQKISFSWKQKPEGFQIFGTPVDRICVIEIDGRFFGDAYFFQGELKTGSYTLEQLAINDGFDTVQDFFDWFREDFSGKIIHWTDLKY